MKSENSLLNFGFISLNIVVLFAFSNIAIFFSFYNYLGTLPIAKEWHGIIIGMLSATALVVRPFLCTRLTVSNSVQGIGVSLVLTIVSLLLYTHAQSLVSIVLVRILHGIAFVGLVSSSITLLMAFLPAEKSGQGFGIITVMTLAPYAIFPLLLENFFAEIPLNTIYACTAFLMIPPFFFLFPLWKYTQKRVKETVTCQTSNSSIGTIWYNIRQPQILSLLLANGVLYSVFALVLYFLKTFSAETGVGDPGLFFTVATITMIVFRVFLGSLLDAFDKAIFIIISFLFIVVSLLLLAYTHSSFLFYSSALLYGIGVGAAAPLLNSLMYIVSEAEQRAVNANIMLEMVDMGFFIGPGLCGIAVTFNQGQTAILTFCICILGLASILIYPLRKK
ncbi:MAG: hypothetical protein OCC45_04115 [Desulfotalea sp.]